MSSPGSAASATTDKHRRLLDVMRSMGAVDEEHARTGDDIMKVGKLPKGQLLDSIQQLEALGLVGRTKSHKAHRYYVRQTKR